jgi:histidyl-tRNA synthetase
MSNQTTKTPRTLQGFNDYFAQDIALRNYVKEIFRVTFEKYGYEPLETPALEFSELMLGQSGEEAEKQYYRFEDNGGRDVMLKFEVMISMCRALAQNINSIPLPYKRYQIQNVWRAEKVQKGRYREFTQIDADTIGSKSIVSDAEIIQMGIEIISKLGFTDFEGRISNRKFLEGLAVYLGIPEEKYYSFFMSIDKLAKIGSTKVINELVTVRGIERASAEQAMSLINLERYKGKSFQEILDSFSGTVGTNEVGKQGISELQEINNYLILNSVDTKYYRFDPTIARGLASYTGPVWEFTILEGGVGSISGGGRYDKAISKYIGQEVPATGGSFGLERICDIIKDRNMLTLESPLKVLVIYFSPETFQASLMIANELRLRGIATFFYPENVKLDKQLKYADKKNIPYVVVIGNDELEKGEAVLKDMKNRTQQTYPLSELPSFIS